MASNNHMIQKKKKGNGLVLPTLYAVHDGDGCRLWQCQTCFTF